MITKKDALDRITQLIEDIGPEIYKEAARLLDSGAVEFEDHADNFILPRLVLNVALANVGDGYKFPARMMTAKFRRDHANLRHF